MLMKEFKQIYSKYPDSDIVVARKNDNWVIQADTKTIIAYNPYTFIFPICNQKSITLYPSRSQLILNYINDNHWLIGFHVRDIYGLLYLLVRDKTGRIITHLIDQRDKYGLSVFLNT